MLAKAVQPLFREQLCQEEEHRLLNELTHIDQRLKSKNDSQRLHDSNKGWGRNQTKEESNLFKWNCGKDNPLQPIYSTNMEYFSEICNEDIDEDSLFDPHNNFLGPTRPNKQEAIVSNIETGFVVQQKEDKVAHVGRLMPRKNSRSQAVLPSQTQLSKQRNYAYKKDAQNQLTPSKGYLPPKNSKIVSNKTPVIPSKSGQRKSNISNNKENINSKNQIRKSITKPRYLEKPVIVQAQESLTSQNQFNFHTFQAYLQQGPSQDTSERVTRKDTKCRHQDFDRQSLECTFKPTILKRSSQMVKGNKNVVERLSNVGISSKDLKRPYQPQNNKPTPNKSRLQQLSQPRRIKTQAIEQVQQAPSFRPSLSKKSLEQMSHCIHDVATRNQLWLQQKEEKIQKLRQEQEEEKRKKEDCTYSPAICQYKGDSGPHLSRFGKQGMVNYFERLSGVSKVESKSKLIDSKENRQSLMNLSKENFQSKGGKKQRYDDAVKQLHSRIMGLKI